MSNREMSEQGTQFMLGNLIPTGVTPGRDAIHIAVAPVIVVGRLSPGQPVGLVPGLETHVQALGPVGQPVGVIDPFLGGPVFDGERCFLWLYPNTITGLRHEWTHPAFTAAPAPQTISHMDHLVKSRAWLEAKAAQLDLTYKALMRAAALRLREGEYTVQQGSERWRDEFGDPREFWHHYQTVTGEVVDEPEQTVFCCSC